MSTDALTLHDAALHYAELGYLVFPLSPRSKLPRAGSHGLLDATTNVEQIARWWTDEPAYNIGIRTDGLIVIDPDLLGKETANPQPNPWLTADIAHSLAVAPTQRTWSGGRQYIFKQPAGKQYRNGEGLLADNVDTRGNGGYIVIAPSFVRVDKRSGYYQFAPGCELDVPPEQLPEPPAWLIAELDAIEERRGKTRPENGNGNHAKKNGNLADAHINGIPEGKRNGTLASMAGAMRRKGFEQAAIEAALLATNESQCDPRLPEDEVRRIAASVARYQPATATVANQQPAVVATYRRFPVDVLPGIIGDYVTDSANAIGCDPGFVALPLLASLASAIGNTRRVSLKRTWQEPCILWTAIVGDSGTHKTPALSAATAILSRKQGEALAGYESRLADWQVATLKYEADLAEWKKAKGGTRGEPPEKPDVPVCQRYVVSDTTIEALADRLQHAPRGLLLERDELAGWLNSFDQYKGGKGGDTAHWLTLHNAKPLRIDRKTERKLTYVPIASVSIAGGIQPETLRRALGREHFENGLAARLLLAYPPKQPRRWTEHTVCDSIERSMADVFAGLLALDFGQDADGRPAPIDLPLTPEAREAWIDFYDRHGGEQMEMTGSEAALWSKLEGVAPRLALILQLAADPASVAVDETSMAAGITLAEWFGHEGRRVYGVIGESDEGREQRQLVELIEQRGGSVTVRELMRASRRYANAEVAQAALDTLASAGNGRWAATDTTAKGGRPTMVFRLADAADADTTPEITAKTEVVSTVSTPEWFERDVNWLLDEAAEYA